MCRKADQQRVKSNINNEPSNKLKENEWICNFCSFVKTHRTTKIIASLYYASYLL